jgi:hypothetical protein
MSISLPTLVGREMSLRWITALHAVFIVAAAVAMVLLAEQFAAASENATRRIQRDIGLNIVILPPQTDLDAWWIDRLPTGSMPEAWIERLEDQDVANRLVPMLVARVPVGDAEIILTGIGSERFKRGNAMKPVFGRSIEPGNVVLGALAGKVTGAREGEPLVIKGRSFTVERILEPMGSEEDVRCWMTLPDAQSLLQLEGRLNEIRAIECHCSEDVQDPLEAIRTELEPIVPGAGIVRMNALADARRAQRQMAERFIEYAIPPLLVLAGVIVAALALMNVRERRNEMGVLLAHGYRRSTVASVVLSRSFIIGLVGAVIGWVFAIVIGDSVITSIIGSGKPPRLDSTLLLATIFSTPILCALAALYPAIMAAMVDPARLMRLP